MPTLLSPRGSITKQTPEDDGATVTKKPKGVMGRIKSTFKLGRRKSSTGSASAAAAAEAATLHRSADKDDVPLDNPEDRQNNDANRGDEQADEEKAVEPYKEDDATEIKQFSTANDDADEESSTGKQPTELETSQLAATSDRVATFELPAKNEPPPTAAEEEEQEEEVFACDYKPGEGLQVDDAKPSHGADDDDDDDHLEAFADHDEDRGGNSSGSGGNSGNQSPPAPAASARGFGAPHESDLMIVGVSPTKLRHSLGPSASPVKRSHPPPLAKKDDPSSFNAGNQDATVAGPSRSDAEPSLGDRIASAHSTRPTRQPPVPSSPVRRSQLLSDFQFGTDALHPATGATSSPVPSSPMKRRASGSPSPSLPMRRSFQRDQEQQLTINASSPLVSPAASPSASKRKPDTPSAVPTIRATRPERRSSLQGITEEDQASAGETKLPPRPSAGAGRRRASSMEAPILASSFVAAAPEVHDDSDHAATFTADDFASLQAEASRDDTDRPQADETGAGAFAFDAGAAITQEFGERVARLLGADPWGDRQDGFDAILYHIKKTDLATAKNRRELFCAAIAAVQCGVEDRVAPVMYCALDCLRGVLKEFATVLDRSFLKYQPMNEQLSGLAKVIVGKLGDSNKRTQREAAQAVVRLAKLKKLKVLPHVLLHLSAKEVAPRQRMETLRLLVKELGVDASTIMNVEVVMQFAVPVLKIADEKTRKAAVELIAELHLINGQAVNAQLAGVKPEMLRVINRRVDELLAKRDSERQEHQAQVAAQNANQAEEDDRASAMTLVAIPVEESKAVQTMLETMTQQAQHVVGPVVWRKLESKTWSDRKEALVDVEKTITEAKSDLRDVKPAFHSVVQTNFLAYCTVVHRCLADSIAPVVNSAMDAYATLLKVYGPCVEWREDAVRDLTVLTILRLFGTMQKPNTRTNRAACRCILKLTRLSSAHTLRYAVSCVVAKETDPLVQMHLLRLLIPEFGFQSDGISAHLVLELVAPALCHSNDKVRKTASDVALCTQRLVGKDVVLKKLKDVVKPVTLKELEKLFVDIEVQKDAERPQTVHATAASSGSFSPAMGALPPVQVGGDAHARRLLNSAPVGLGKLYCTPPNEAERDATTSLRRASVLSNDEESLMDSILGGGDDV